MAQHRFREHLAAEARRPLSEPVSALPLSGFMVCPLALTQSWQGQPCPWEEVYRLAYEQAQAAARPSRWERAWAESSN